MRYSNQALTQNTHTHTHKTLQRHLTHTDLRTHARLNTHTYTHTNTHRPPARTHTQTPGGASKSHLLPAHHPSFPHTKGSHIGDSKLHGNTRTHTHTNTQNTKKTKSSEKLQ